MYTPRPPGEGGGRPPAVRQLHRAAPQGDGGGGLRAVLGAPRLEDVLDVDLDLLFRDEQAFGDVAVAVAAGQLLQHRQVARGKGPLAQDRGDSLPHLGSVVDSE
jgi:hypothetical protein